MNKAKFGEIPRNSMLHQIPSKPLTGEAPKSREQLKNDTANFSAILDNGGGGSAGSKGAFIQPE